MGEKKNTKLKLFEKGIRGKFIKVEGKKMPTRNHFCSFYFNISINFIKVTFKYTTLFILTSLK